MPELHVTLGDLAEKLDGASGIPLMQGVGPGLSARAYFETSRNTFGNGTHLAEVEVDPETGQVEINRRTGRVRLQQPNDLGSDRIE